jgi:hypothetical protein
MEGTMNSLFFVFTDVFFAFA